MYTIREETDTPIDKKNAHDSYTRYMALALDARSKGDGVSFEGYCQRAEHYLHLMGELNGDVPMAPTQMTEPSPQSTALPFRKNYLRRKRRGA